MSETNNIVGLPEVNIEDIESMVSGIGSDDLKKMRDGIRVFDSGISVVLWKRQKAGEKVFTETTYSPDERISHYAERGNKYVKRTVGHGIDAVLDLLSKFLPGTIISILKAIFKI